MISFPSWHNTEGCRDCVSSAEPGRPAAPTYLQIPPRVRVNCDEHVIVYIISRNDLNDEEKVWTALCDHRDSFLKTATE